MIKEANGDKNCLNRGAGYGASETGSTGLLPPEKEQRDRALNSD
jgi:hypothetical protein